MRINNLVWSGSSSAVWKPPQTNLGIRLAAVRTPGSLAGYRKLRQPGRLRSFTRLKPAQADPASFELKMGTEYRDVLVVTQIQTVNRLHAIMNLPVLAGAPRQLNADNTAELLRRVHSADEPSTGSYFFSISAISSS